MFQAYATVVRAAYLSAIVVGPLFIAESLATLVRQWTLGISPPPGFLLFVLLVFVPSARAWRRLTARGELIPATRLRARAFVAVMVALFCLLGLLAAAAYVDARWFVEIDFEGPEIVPALATLLLYSIVLPATELFLVGGLRRNLAQ